MCENKKGEGREREKEGRERERESEGKTENVRERCLHIVRGGEGFEVFEAVLARAIVWG